MEQEQKVKDYLYSLLTSEESRYLKEWLSHDKKIPSNPGYHTAEVSIKVSCVAVSSMGSALTTTPLKDVKE